MMYLLIILIPILVIYPFFISKSIDKHTLTECSKCHSKNIDYATRIIGYLTKISSWSKDRRAEHQRRMYADASGICCDKKDKDKTKEDDKNNKEEK